MGLALFMIGLAGFLSSESFGMGGLEYIALLVGILLLLIGIVWMVSYFSRVRRFNALVEENRKAVFIKNMDDVEYLAWRLPSRFEEELHQKKKGFGLR